MKRITTEPKPIAYENGTAGGIYHCDCWYKFADEKFKMSNARAFLGRIFYPGSKELKNQSCKYCNQPFHSKASV